VRGNEERALGQALGVGGGDVLGRAEPELVDAARLSEPHLLPEGGDGLLHVGSDVYPRLEAREVLGVEALLLGGGEEHGLDQLAAQPLRLLVHALAQRRRVGREREAVEDDGLA